jgi:hypothetical protein
LVRSCRRGCRRAGIGLPVGGIRPGPPAAAHMAPAAERPKGHTRGAALPEQAAARRPTAPAPAARANCSELEAAARAGASTSARERTHSERLTVQHTVGARRRARPGRVPRRYTR